MLKIKFTREQIYYLISILIGTIVGFVSMYICIIFNLAIYGFNMYFIFSPLIAGFIETYFSKKLTGKSTGAISSIVLFIATNIMGWLFPVNPITWNALTIGGLLVMLQAAFPLTINYIILSVSLVIIYVLGLVGEHITSFFIGKRDLPLLKVKELTDIKTYDVMILNNQPSIPIKEYHGLIFAEEVIEFEEKSASEVINYAAASLEDRKISRIDDYNKSLKYVLESLKKEALNLGANVIIDIEIEYTNYNQQLPPDMLIAVYGTAVTIDEKYIS